MSTKNIEVAFLMADYGHDPTETAIPFQAFKKAGFSISIITEAGNTPECDQKMLSGWTGFFLGANKAAFDAYHELANSKEWHQPLSWSSESTSLANYDLVFLPGGHDKGIRQLLDSSRAQHLVAEYWPSVKQPNKKCCAAICHGVQFLAHTKINGRSVLHDTTTTALTSMMENTAYWATRLFLGDYYKTYGSCTPNVEHVVKASLEDPAKQWMGSANTSVPFVIADPQYNYLSSRFPGDASELAAQVVDRVRKLNQAKMSLHE